MVLRFLGTSGQNVDDLEKYSEAKDKIEFMERTLRWRHLAPTAPNTLGTSIILSAMSLFCSRINVLGGPCVLFPTVNLVAFLFKISLKLSI